MIPWIRALDKASGTGQNSCHYLAMKIGSSKLTILLLWPSRVPTYYLVDNGGYRCQG